MNAERPRRRNWARVALLAGTVQGCWAAFANHEHGAMIALRAGLAQAAVSALGGATMTLLMEWLFSLPRRRWARFAASALGSIAVFGTLIVGVHWLRGTPNLLRTIALPGTILPIYAVVYSAALSRADDRSP